MVKDLGHKFEGPIKAMFKGMEAASIVVTVERVPGPTTYRK